MIDLSYSVNLYRMSLEKHNSQRDIKNLRKLLVSKITWHQFGFLYLNKETVTRISEELDIELSLIKVKVMTRLVTIKNGV